MTFLVLSLQRQCLLVLSKQKRRGKNLDCKNLVSSTVNAIDRLWDELI